MNNIKKIAIIASNNGLGHIRRCIVLANSLSKKFNVTLFCLKEKVEYFEINKKVKIINFEIKKYKNIIFNKKNNIHKFFIFKNKFDIFLCDNYPEILNQQKNAIMVSNFFWHDILRINTEYYKKLEKKIAKRPIVANYLFVSKYLKKKFNIIPVGFYGKFLNTSFNDRKKNSILLTFGTAKLSSQNKIEINSFLKNIIKLKDIKTPIYLEPRYHQKNFEKFNIFKAKYDEKMYSKIAIAIIKPGLGTITDCLSRGITIMTYTKNQNKEFYENALILEKNNLGINFFNLTSALNFALLIIKEKTILKKFNIAKKLKWNGEKEILKIINKLFYKKLLIYNEKYEDRIKQLSS